MKKYILKDGRIIIGIHKALEKDNNILIDRIEEIPDEVDTEKNKQGTSKK